MIEKIVDVNLDEGKLPTIVECTEGDTMWRWHFRIFYQSQRWIIPTGSRVWFTGKKADGNVFDLRKTLSNNEAVVDSEVQITAAPGPCVCVIRILDSAAKTIATCPVLLNVKANPQNEGPVSETVLTGYDEVLAELATLMEAAERISGLTASATTLAAGSSATATVTGGTDGTPYNLALGIPKGDKGEKGDTGPQGPKGVDGTGAVSTVMGVGPDSSHDVTKASLMNLIYPVGSIYMSVNSASPATLFGGSWERIQDTFLLAAGSGYAAGGTGGSATHTLSVQNIPAHSHEVLVEPAVGSFDRGGVFPGTGVSWAGSSSGSGQSIGTVVEKNSAKALYVTDQAYASSPEAVSNLPPYLAVYVWKRTA